MMLPESDAFEHPVVGMQGWLMCCWRLQGWCGLLCLCTVQLDVTLQASRRSAGLALTLVPCVVVTVGPQLGVVVVLHVKAVVAVLAGSRLCCRSCRSCSCFTTQLVCVELMVRHNCSMQYLACGCF